MRKRIVLVDDEKDFCYFMQKTLQASGDFEVLTTSEGKEAVGLIKAHRPDIVLLDIMMPEFSGPDVAAELREYDRTKNIPIVFVTAVVKEGETLDNNNLIGGWHYMAKPVNTPDLVDLIRQLT